MPVYLATGICNIGSFILRVYLNALLGIAFTVGYTPQVAMPYGMSILAPRLSKPKHQQANMLTKVPHYEFGVYNI
jgi:hypothetical protein